MAEPQLEARLFDVIRDSGDRDRTKRLHIGSHRLPGTTTRVAVRDVGLDHGHRWNCRGHLDSGIDGLHEDNTFHSTKPGRAFSKRESKRDTTFEVIPLVGNGVTGSSFELRFGQPLMDFATQRIDFTEEGRLVLTDPCCDGFSYEWRRII